VTKVRGFLEKKFVNYDRCSVIKDNQIFNVFAVVKNIKKIYNSANLIVF